MKKTIKKTANKSPKKRALPYVIVRCVNAGVHAGYLVSRKGNEVVLSNARRIWYWSGAATLSELALKGPRYPDKCKFSVVLPTITLLDACEIIPCMADGGLAIEAVLEWRV